MDALLHDMEYMEYMHFFERWMHHIYIDACV
jgi:hypothetical protein